MLIDSATTPCFASHLSLNHNGLVGECIRGPKVVVRNALELRHLQCFLLVAVSPSIHSFSEKTFLGLRFNVPPHFKCVEFLFWVTNNERVECVYSTS